MAPQLMAIKSNGFILDLFLQSLPVATAIKIIVIPNATATFAILIIWTETLPLNLGFRRILLAINRGKFKSNLFVKYTFKITVYFFFLSKQMSCFSQIKITPGAAQLELFIKILEK